MLTRRAFCSATFGAIAGAAISGCDSSPGPDTGPSRLSARPTARTGTINPGLTTLADDTGRRDGLLHVPQSYDPAVPMPLVVGFHGAGGSANGPMNLLRPHADTAGFIVLTIDSRDSTWDAIFGPYGPDVEVVDRRLRFTFEHCAIAADHVFIEGFSDGASYALGLGLANGDLFRRVVAFSPGFIPEGGRAGKPPVFESHGINDIVLPIDDTSRRIVASLRADGYDVQFREFAGGHEVPEGILQEAVEWLLGPGTPATR